MEGLEIKEKKLYEVLSNKDFRIDSSFYTKEPKKIRILFMLKSANILFRRNTVYLSR